MLCFRCVSLLHWVQEVMNIEDAVALYSILVRVWAYRNTFTNGSCYCVHKGDVNDATYFNTYCIKSIAMYCTVVYRASFPKPVTQIRRHYLTCFLNNAQFSSWANMKYRIQCYRATNVCNTWDNVRSPQTSITKTGNRQTFLRAKVRKSVLLCGALMYCHRHHALRF